MERTRQGRWTRQDSAAYYLVDRWGAPYFHVNGRGNLAFAPAGDANQPGADADARAQVDLRELVEVLRADGVEAPILVRFDDVLGHRVASLCNAFAQSIAANHYAGSFQAVMPIKVNQQRHVVEALLAQAERRSFGLEAGSKPELLAAIALLQGRRRPLLVCNGYKDTAYIETALQSTWLGIECYLVLDRFAELQLVLDAARKTGIRPRIGVRAKLTARGAGRWKESSGDRSKFGLCAAQMVEVVAQLRAENMLDCLQLLHFHLGSQISAIHCVKSALREAGHIYAGLRNLGADALRTVDCGGGLAVDYDGSRTDFHASMNYSLQEYADDVVGTMTDICSREGQPHPNLITESGRALLAQHAVLVFNVLGVQTFGGTSGKAFDPGPKSHDRDVKSPGHGQGPGHGLLERMQAALQLADDGKFQEAYNDVVALKDEAETSFDLGAIDLTVRARAEALFWATCRQVRERMGRADHVPNDLQALVKALSDIYYCNFSIFQSLPDSWALGHLFPIVPLHRHDERPERDAILADLTCDSDGKLDKFIDLQKPRDTLRLHAPNGEAYYLGAFLVGAYQEILGDLHNLFGDTNAVHVAVRADGSYTLEHVVQGDSIADVLRYVAYDPQQLVGRVRAAAQRGVEENRCDAAQLESFMRGYEEGLRGTTYLEDID